MNKLSPGLVSVTFRGLNPGEVLKLAVSGAISGIEWGGDVHVPHGDVRRAKEVARLTAEHGLSVAAYGSYFRAGDTRADRVAFEPVLASAVALGAPTIRIWAGTEGSAMATAGQRQMAITEIREAAAAAAGAGISISIEYHPGTLNDTSASSLGLLAELPTVFTYWQPPCGNSRAANLVEFEAIAPFLSHIHVHHWKERQLASLDEGAGVWREYLHAVALPEMARYAMLEFVKNDDPAAFLKDAATLRSLLEARS